MSGTAQDPLLFRFFNEIGIIEQLARNRFERSLPDGLKMPQFIVLNHLVRLGGEWSPARLAAAFQLTKGAMTNTLQRLEARRLVKISADPRDGRGKLVGLTDAGRHMRERCVDSVGGLLEQLSREVSEHEVAAAMPILEIVRRYLDSRRD